MISGLCLRQVDIKVLIAYSSVCHIAPAIARALLLSVRGYYAFVLIILAHGLVSPGIFILSYFVYERRHTRNILLISSLLSYTPILTAWWFVFCIANFGGPYTLNLVREIFVFLALGRKRIFLGGIMIFISFVAAAYSLILFRGISQGPTRFLFSFGVCQFRVKENILRFLLLSLTIIVVGILPWFFF